MVFLKLSDSRGEYFLKQTIAKFDNAEEVIRSYTADLLCCKKVPKEWAVHSQAFRFWREGISCTVFKTRYSGSRFSPIHSSFRYSDGKLIMSTCKWVPLCFD